MGLKGVLELLFSGPFIIFSYIEIYDFHKSHLLLVIRHL